MYLQCLLKIDKLSVHGPMRWLIRDRPLPPRLEPEFNLWDTQVLEEEHRLP